MQQKSYGISGKDKEAGRHLWMPVCFIMISCVILFGIIRYDRLNQMPEDFSFYFSFHILHLLLNEIFLRYQIFHAVSSELRLMPSTILIILLAESILIYKRRIFLCLQRNFL